MIHLLLQSEFVLNLSFFYVKLDIFIGPRKKLQLGCILSSSIWDRSICRFYIVNCTFSSVPEPIEKAVLVFPGKKLPMRVVVDQCNWDQKYVVFIYELTPPFSCPGYFISACIFRNCAVWHFKNFSTQKTSTYCMHFPKCMLTYDDNFLFCCVFL